MYAVIEQELQIIFIHMLKRQQERNNQSQNSSAKEKRYLPSPYHLCTDQKLIGNAQLSILNLELHSG